MLETAHRERVGAVIVVVGVRFIRIQVEVTCVLITSVRRRRPKIGVVSYFIDLGIVVAVTSERYLGDISFVHSHP